jgi:hypothetical protein
VKPVPPNALVGKPARQSECLSKIIPWMRATTFVMVTAAPIRTIMNVAPQIPQVTCFDTAFHRSQSYQPPIEAAARVEITLGAPLPGNAVGRFALLAHDTNSRHHRALRLGRVSRRRARGPRSDRPRRVDRQGGTEEGERERPRAGREGRNPARPGARLAWRDRRPGRRQFSQRRSRISSRSTAC